MKNYGNKGEAWVETWHEGDWKVICEAKLIFAGSATCLIDDLVTIPSFRRKGYATKLVKELQKRFPVVGPISIQPNAKPFWDRLSMKNLYRSKE